MAKSVARLEMGTASSSNLCGLRRLCFQIADDRVVDVGDPARLPVAMYTTLLFDLDHTLLDSDQSEALAFHATMQRHGVDDPSRHIEAYQRINRALWARVERQEISPLDLRTARFSQLIEAIGLDVDPEHMATSYVEALGDHGDLYAGAADVLAALAQHATLALITNGLSEVQRRRLARLEIAHHFHAVIISAEVGASKPSSKIFELAFAALGEPARHTALMIGDNLNADVKGGRDFGIATCWYNPKRQRAGADDVVTHDIHRLDELLPLVRPRP